MFLGCVSLALVFTGPLWEITLEAAQFPDPLKLHIWVHQITGSEKNIVQNINILNHYIGMQYIEPDSIPELKYFPYVIYGMIALGILALSINNKWGYLSWVILLVILGILGIYDFYLWLYDYGHNLDPKAAIKVPGMTYMPPLFGEKDLLNFYVSSYPHIGSFFLSIAGLFAFFAFYAKKRIDKSQTALS